ncbi:MAG: hypothetical protein O3A00_01470 [Planctomycetota bacterium]|nr:hypothetical protein [Planctomycetota bacterium]
MPIVANSRINRFAAFATTFTIEQYALRIATVNRSGGESNHGQIDTRSHRGVRAGNPAIRSAMGAVEANHDGDASSVWINGVVYLHREFEVRWFADDAQPA